MHPHSRERISTSASCELDKAAPKCVSIFAVVVTAPEYVRHLPRPSRCNVFLRVQQPAVRNDMGCVLAPLGRERACVLDSH